MSELVEEAAEQATERASEIAQDEGDDSDGGGDSGNYGDGEAHPHWVRRVALGALLMALVSAIGALLGGISGNEALVTRTEAIIEVSRQRSDVLEIAVLGAKHAQLAAAGQSIDPAEKARLDMLRQRSGELGTEVSTEQATVEHTLWAHERFAIGVTLLSTAISICGIVLLTRRRRLWHVSLVVAAIGTAVVALAALGLFT